MTNGRTDERTVKMGTDGRTDGRTNGKLFSKVGYHTIPYPYKRYDTLPYKRHEVAHTMSKVLPGGGALHVDLSLIHISEPTRPY